MRQPDYERGNVRLWNCDCREILGSVEADCVVTDPPYGISHPCGFGTRGRGSTAGCRANGKKVWSNPRSNDYVDVAGDNEPFDPSLILSLNLPTALWGANHFASRLPDASGWIVWDKLRPDELDQATCELAWSNCVKGVRRFAHLWNGMMRASEHGENYHPTQKPVALFAWLLSLRWIPNGTVLDPYMGSAPCGVACVRLGRGFLGIELEPRYFDIAAKRIDEAFDAEPLFADLEVEHQADLFAEAE